MIHPVAQYTLLPHHVLEDIHGVEAVVEPKLPRLRAQGGAAIVPINLCTGTSTLLNTRFAGGKTDQRHATILYAQTGESVTRVLLVPSSIYTSMYA